MTYFRTWLSRVLHTICVVLFATLVVLVVWQVFTRLVLNNPSPWTSIAAQYTFVWVSLIGIAIATGEKADVVMDFLVEKLPRPLQRVADILAYLCTLAFVLSVMVFGGLKQASLAWAQQNPVLPFTQGELYLALPVSGCVLSLYLVLHIANALSRHYEGHKVLTEDEEAASL